MHRLGLSLIFDLNGDESQWDYDGSYISASTALEDFTADTNFFGESLKAIALFVKKIQDGSLINNPVSTTAISAGFSEEIKDENGTIKWEYTISDLVVQIILTKATGEYTYSRTAFNLTWSNFLHFYNRLEQFFKQYI